MVCIAASLCPFVALPAATSSGLARRKKYYAPFVTVGSREMLVASMRQQLETVICTLFHICTAFSSRRNNAHAYLFRLEGRVSPIGLQPLAWPHSQGTRRHERQNSLQLSLTRE